MGAVSFQPTADDLIAAYRAFFLSALRSARMARIWLIGGALFALLAQAFAWGDRWPAHAGWGLAGLAYWSVLLAIIQLVNYLLLPRRVRRIFAQQKTLHDPVAVDWSADGVTIASPRGTTRFAWTDFHRFADGRHAVLLFQSDALFNFIPKRVLTPAEVAELGAHARGAAGG